MDVKYYTTYTEVKAFLRKKGTKLAVRVGNSETYIYAQKSDCVALMDARIRDGQTGPTTYDDEPDQAKTLESEQHTTLYMDSI